MIKKDELKPWIMIHALHKELVIDPKKRFELDTNELIETYNRASIEKRNLFKKIILKIKKNLKKREEMESLLLKTENFLKPLKEKDKDIQLKKERLSKEETQGPSGKEQNESFLQEIELKEERPNNKVIAIFEGERDSLNKAIEKIDKSIKKTLVESIEYILYFSKKAYNESDDLDYFNQLNKEQIDDVFNLGCSCYLIDYLLDEKNMMKSTWDELKDKEKVDYLLIKGNYRNLYFSLLLLKNLRSDALLERDKNMNFTTIKTIYNNNLLPSWYHETTHDLIKFNLSDYINLVKNHKKIKKIIPTKGEIKALEISMKSLRKEEKEILNAFEIIGRLKGKYDIGEKTYSFNRKRVHEFYVIFKKILPIIDEILNDQLPLYKISNINKIERKEKVILYALLEGNLLLNRRNLKVSIIKKEEGEILYELKEVTHKMVGKKIYENEKEIREALFRISKETGLKFNLVELRLAIVEAIKNNKEVNKKTLEAMKEFVIKSKETIDRAQDKEILNKEWIERNWLEKSLSYQSRMRKEYFGQNTTQHASSLGDNLRKSILSKRK